MFRFTDRQCCTPREWSKKPVGQPGRHTVRHAVCATSAMLVLSTIGCATVPGVDTTAAPPRTPSATPLDVVNQADLLYAQHQYDQAQAAFTSLAQAHPSNAYFWFRLGNCEIQLARYPEAIRAFEQARSIDPRDGRFSYNLAIAYSAMGRDAFTLAREQLPVGSPLRRDAEQNRRLLEATVGTAASAGR